MSLGLEDGGKGFIQPMRLVVSRGLGHVTMKNIP